VIGVWCKVKLISQSKPVAFLANCLQQNCPIFQSQLFYANKKAVILAVTNSILKNTMRTKKVPKQTSSLTVRVGGTPTPA
jgi:hypothetical protein